MEANRRIKKISKLLDVKESDVLVEMKKHPELFIKVKSGFIGRTGRDEYLRDKYRKR